MNLRRKHSEGAELAAESMNDIMFFLLLFFLIISTLVNPNVIKLMLPNAKQAKQMNKQPITLSVNEHLEYFINNNSVPISSNNLESMLAYEIKKTNDPTIVLRLDRSLKIQDLVDVLQIGEKLKCKMVLASQNKK
ncbi:MAG: biopolymer transporter ExbD [Saprospiraceae bacterium]|nr:biopolymer transporter ExbD [Saprospiraceae bacterium]